jgi:hypothetical protein
MPESPRWLCTKSRVSEARAVLQKLHPSGAADTDENSFAESELRQIRVQLEIENQTTTSHGWEEAFTKPSYRKRLFYGFFVQ